MLSLKTKTHNFYSKIINIGVKGQTTSLNAIRLNYINIANYLIVIINLFILMWRINNGEWTKCSLAITSLSMSSLSIYLCYKHKYNLAILVTTFAANFIAFISCQLNIFNPIDALPQIFIVILGTLLFIPDKKIRMIYIGCCVLFLAYIFDFNLMQHGPLILKLLGAMLVHNYFISFIESQDQKLNSTVESLKISNEKSIVLNQTLNEKNEELITFSHIMGHDLKAPLRNIVSFLGLIKQKEKFEDERSKEFFSIIEHSASSMQNLIDDLLTYSKISTEENQLLPVNINNVVEEVISNFRYEMDYNQVSINIEELPHIIGDKQMMKILFHNLISNAIKYQPKDQADHVPSVDIIYLEDVANPTIQISDNGIGIHNEDAKELFQPFRRFHSEAEYDGSGLGLSICQRIMEKHDGNIELVDTSKEGSTFQLTFSNGR